MSSSNVFGALISSLTASGANQNVITEAVAAVGAALNTTASQVNSKLAALAALLNSPQAYAAASPAIISDVEALVSTKYPQVLPLLEKLRTTSDPLTVAQLIQSIEEVV